MLAFASIMPTINLAQTDLIVMVVYMAAVVGFGLYKSSRRGAEDYFLVGRGMTWPVIGLSMLAMCVSSRCSTTGCPARSSYWCSS